jgi:hypothetical protein
MTYAVRLLRIIGCVVLGFGCIQAVPDNLTGLNAFFKKCVIKNDEVLVAQAEEYSMISQALLLLVQKSGATHSDIEHCVITEKILFDFAHNGLGELNAVDQVKEYVRTIFNGMKDVRKNSIERLSLEKERMSSEDLQHLMDQVMNQEKQLEDLDFITRMQLFVYYSESFVSGLRFLDMIVHEHAEYFKLFAICNTLAAYYGNLLIIPQTEEDIFVWEKNLTKTVVARDFAECADSGWFTRKPKPYHSFDNVLQKNIKRMQQVSNRLGELSAHYGKQSQLGELAQTIIVCMNTLHEVIVNYPMYTSE